jgi:glucans biosynthesis protein C
VKRLAYLDRLKVFMTVLVVLHHTAITYGGSGSWYYNEHQENDIAIGLLSTFTAVNQSFFMGLFFFISGFVTPASYDKKGANRFIKERLIRCGIPIIIFMLVLDPLLGYVSSGYQGSMASYLIDWKNLLQGFNNFAVGPLWYLFALLLFFAAYTVFRMLTAGRATNTTLSLTTRLIASYIVIVAVANFIVRLAFPVGEEVLNLQLAYFPAYIGLFIGGVAAYRGNWLEQLTDAAARKWRKVVIVLVILLPVGMVLGGALEGDTSFEGGMTWQSAFYSLIDPLLGLGISYMLLVWFRKRWNDAPTKAAGWLSANAFLVYIIHALILTYVSYSLRDILLNPLLKFVLIGCVVLPVCFIAAAVIRQIPGIKRVV